MSAVDANFTTTARRRRLFHNNVDNRRHRSLCTADVHRRLIFIDCCCERRSRPPTEPASQPTAPRWRSRAGRWCHDVIACMLMRRAHSIISALLRLLLLRRGNWRPSISDHLPLPRRHQSLTSDWQRSTFSHETLLLRVYWLGYVLFSGWTHWTGNFTCAKANGVVDRSNKCTLTLLLGPIPEGKQEVIKSELQKWSRVTAARLCRCPTPKYLICRTLRHIRSKVRR